MQGSGTLKKAHFIRISKGGSPDALIVSLSERADDNADSRKEFQSWQELRSLLSKVAEIDDKVLDKTKTTLDDLHHALISEVMLTQDQLCELGFGGG